LSLALKPDSAWLVAIEYCPRKWVPDTRCWMAETINDRDRDRRHGWRRSS